jgi:hypothetical protein
MKKIYPFLISIFITLLIIGGGYFVYQKNSEQKLRNAEQKLREESLTQIVSKSERFRSIFFDTQDRGWDNAEEQEEIISFINKSLPQFDEDTQNLLLDWVDEARVIRVVTCQGCSWYGVWDKESYRELMDAYDAEKRIQDIENRIQGTLDKY